VFPNGHPLYLGMSGLGPAAATAERLASADLILAVGARLSEKATLDYAVPAAGTRLIHADIDPEGLGGQGQAALGITADAALCLQALLDAAAADPLPAERHTARLAAIR